ncbi:MAG: response regulator [Terriglobales bacterium]
MGKRILLVDDEPSIRFVLGAVLEQAGYKVDSAEDGFVALRKLQSAMPDLVVTDLRMPNMNGFELLSVLRTRFPQLPTIAISGEFLRSADESPIADAFFQKGSYRTDDFLATIASLLSGAREKQHPIERTSVWAPTGDAPLMLTCTKCLRSFPIEACEGGAPPKETDCVFCGAHLDVTLVAVGVAPNA